MSGTQIVILISAQTEWRTVLDAYPDSNLLTSPYGAYFYADLFTGSHNKRVIFFQGGWGKIAAAASTQYVIDHFSPSHLINLGTCGGFEGEVQPGEIILAERTLVYDIIEQMGDSDEAITAYTTEIDLTWLGAPYPTPVRRTTLISADRDLITEDIPLLKAKYQAIAGDWESGAIAYIAECNQIRCLILRGVSDLVGPQGGEAYGHFDLFEERTEKIMVSLLNALPGWIALL